MKQKEKIPHLEVDHSVHRKLKVFSAATGKSMRVITSIAIQEWLDRQNQGADLPKVS